MSYNVAVNAICYVLWRNARQVRHAMNQNSQKSPKTPKTKPFYKNKNPFYKDKGLLRHVLLIEIANTQLFTHTHGRYYAVSFFISLVNTQTFLRHPDGFFHVHTYGCYVFFVLTELAKMQSRCYAMCIVVQWKLKVSRYAKNKSKKFWNHRC